MIGTGNGLTANYYSGTSLDPSKLVLTRTDPTVNFSWGQGSPDASVSNDNFSARWSGQVQSQTTERYQFATNSDDGLRLKVNGQTIIDNWTNHGATIDTAYVDLVEGQRYDIQMEYYENGGNATAQLLWSTPTIGRQAIPTSQLYSSASALPSSSVYLSDLNPTSSTNGWGPVEKDRSNGEANLGDGRRITIGGVGYDKGLGVHSDSQISYALNGATRFQAVLGVDDEVGNSGSVQFQVFGDGTKLYDSGTVRGTDSGQSVVVDVSGRSTLTLKVLNGGDDYALDHADWADAKLLYGADVGVPGLRVQYFNSSDLNPATLVATKTVANVDYNWGQGSPDPVVSSDNFSARYTGNFSIATGGQYKFATIADDRTRLWVDGQQIIDDWGSGHGAERREGAINLAPGSHSIRLEYSELGGNASLRLEGSGPGFSNQTLSPSFFSNTPIPPGGGSSGPADPYAFNDSIVNAPNDAHPDGVPNYYSWYTSAAQPGWGNDPRKDWNAVTAWGQVYAVEGFSPEQAPDTRVQLRNDQLWILSKSTNVWYRAQAPGIQGGAFASDFGNNGATGVTTKDESANGGGISVTAGNGFNYHFWPGARATMNPYDIAGIYSKFEARLVEDVPGGVDDRSQAHYIASSGADYWRSVDAPFASDWSNNGGVGGGRFKTVTNDWQTYSYSSLAPSVIASNPPPLVPSI